MINKPTILKVPSRLTKNYEDEIIRKLGCFYNYKQEQKAAFYLDFHDVKELDLLGMLILYKFLEYSVINKCFFNPCLLDFEENKVIREKVTYFGFKYLMEELKKSKDSERQYKNLQITVSDDFIIAPMPLLKESNSSDYLNNDYSRKIESYYKDEKVNAMIFTVFSEIFLNFWAHAVGDTKSIIVAHGNQDYIEIACADSGEGIVKSIRDAFPNCKRKDAIMMALTKGVTSKKGSNHMGYGLWLINEMVTQTRSRLLLRSEEYCYENNSGKVSYQISPTWHGTIVYVKLLLENPITIEDIEKHNEQLDKLMINFQ